MTSETNTSTASGAEAGGEAAVDVSIVMPCLNEAFTIGDCIDEANKALAVLYERHGLCGEIVIADNGSTDESIEIATARGARVVDVPDRGYGNALRAGIAAAAGRYVIMGDSDCSYDFRESVGMVEQLLSGHELCMGTRLKGTIEPGAMPWKNRYIGNPVLTGILNLLFGSKLSDAHCGMRAFTKDAFRRLRLTSEGMEFASEMVIKAVLLDLERTEIPITLRPDRRNRPPHLRPWRDGWRHLRYLLMLSPAWIFFIPAAILGGCGTTVFTLLLLYSNVDVVRFGPIWFGDHWMVLSSGLILLSYQAFTLGLATSAYGAIQGYRRPSRLLNRLYRLCRLENLLILGTLLLVAGGAALLSVVIDWRAQTTDQFDRMREMLLSTTLLVLGFQTIFGAFLISVVAGNRSDISAELENGRSQS